MKFVRFMLRLPMAWVIMIFIIISLILVICSYSLKWLAKLITFDFKPKYANNAERRAATKKILGEIEVLILGMYEEDIK